LKQDLKKMEEKQAEKAASAPPKPAGPPPKEK